ncbi:MAG TPA: hypothetical protein VG756_19410 [Pseudonocardiaceae bacterium]|jgi:hypothetical protein|nr:hypothetical protein [Pseudonocardiaceae bacterium]
MHTASDLAHTTDELLADLDSDARWFRPRPFAVYGIRTQDGSPFLGWGIDLPEPRSALFYRPDGNVVWRSSDASNVLRFHEKTGITRLIWLDD